MPPEKTFLVVLESSISAQEKFIVVFINRRTGRNIRGDAIVPQWNYLGQRASWGEWTIQDWKNQKIYPQYDNNVYDVVAFHKDGTIANPNTKLKNLR